MRLRSLLLVVSFSCLHGCTVAVDSDGDRAQPRRFLWVTRWDFADAADVKRVVADADDAGFDALVFQVRGAASTLHHSELEPRAPEVVEMSLDYDPLRLALDAAHERGMELHAWINCVPSWWGSTAPTDTEHVYHSRPEWHWYDQHGHRQELSERFYVSLNPCLPDVRAHVVAVCEELVTNYELDGLHLDYIRFPNEPPATPRGSGSDWPRDAVTLALYREATGLAPDEDEARWDRWRAEQVTELVREIRSMVDARAPTLVLSAAVGSVPERALAEHFQDIDAWIEEDLLDLVLPMNYSADPELFQTRLNSWQPRAALVSVAMGVMVRGDPEVRAGQLERAAQAYDILVVFGYHELFDSSNTVLTTQGKDDSARRAERRARLLPLAPSAPSTSPGY
jgi:uncharacterized lipoprotein YddW (UPF0748 family)